MSQENDAVRLMTFRLDPLLKGYLTELKWRQRKSEAQVLRDLIVAAYNNK